MQYKKQHLIKVSLLSGDGLALEKVLRWWLCKIECILYFGDGFQWEVANQSRCDKKWVGSKYFRWLLGCESIALEVVIKTQK